MDRERIHPGYAERFAAALPDLGYTVGGWW
jgi:hypothetical protein